MEYLDIVDEKGNPIGRIIERKEAHEKGIRHRTSQIWILRKSGTSLISLETPIKRMQILWA